MSTESTTSIKSIGSAKRARPALLAFAAATLLFAAGCAGRHWPALFQSNIPPAGPPRAAIPVKKIVLDNGLPVLFIENNARPLVTVDYWVRAGSADEPTTMSGATHFLEHIVFKGGDRFAAEELDRMVEGVGGMWNAGTSRDYTHFYVNVASDFFEVAVDAIYELTNRARIAPADVEAERRVIIEEYYRKQDNPRSLLFDVLFGESFLEGPYESTVLGTPETLSGIDAAALRDYYERYYAPQNCVLVISGDVHEDRLTSAIAETFARDDRTWRPYRDEAPETVRAAGVREVVDKDVNDTYLGLAFPAPSADSEREVCAIDLLSVVLGGGRSSRLYRRLREKDRLVTTIGAYYPTSRHPSLFFVTATLDSDNLDRAREAIFQEVRRAARKINARELARAKRQTRNDVVYAMETNPGRAGLVGAGYIETGSEHRVEEYLRDIETITAEEVADIAAKYLDPDQAVEVVIAPSGQIESPRQ